MDSKNSGRETDERHLNLLLFASNIKKMCAQRHKCNGCVFEHKNDCNLSFKGMPAAWEVQENGEEDRAE